MKPFLQKPPKAELETPKKGLPNQRRVAGDVVRFPAAPRVAPTNTGERKSLKRPHFQQI